MENVQKLIAKDLLSIGSRIFKTRGALYMGQRNQKSHLLR